MSNAIYKYLIHNNQVRVYVLVGDEIKKEVINKESIIDKELFMQALNNIALYTSLIGEDERISAKCSSFKKKKVISLEGMKNQRITGYMKCTNEEDSFNHGILQVIKSNINQFGSSYTSITEMSSENLYTEFSHYFSKSEQIPTYIFSLSHQQNVTVLIQALPFTLEKDFNQAITQLTTMSLPNRLNQESILNILLSFYNDSKFLEKIIIDYSCGCSKEMFFGLIFSLTEQEIKEILAKNESISINCTLCNKEHVFTPSEIKKYLNI